MGKVVFKGRHKYSAVPAIANGIRFASTKEMKRYTELELLKKAGELLFFLRQVPFHLPGNTKYLCDFMCFWKNGDITFEDVKGFKTETYKLKKKIVEAIYPVQIQEI